MKNGYLKDKENEINAYISADNVEYNGMPLKNYLDIIVANIKQLIMQSSLSIVGSYTYDSTTTEDNQLLQLKPAPMMKNNDMFELQENGDILVVKNTNPNYTPSILGIQSENGNNSLSTTDTNDVYHRIEVWRNGTNIATRGIAQHRLTGTARDTSTVLLTQHLQKGDIIKFTFFANKTGTYNYRGNWFIIQSDTIISNSINFPL